MIPGIVAGGTGRSLAQQINALFAGGEQGAIYDPTDLSTLFQDSAGSIPVTRLEDPVGLMLDKRFGTQRGPELVTNGDMSNGTTGYTVVNASIAIVGGQLEVTGAGTSGRARQSFPTIVGHLYEFTATIDAAGSGAKGLRLGVSDGSPTYLNVAGAGIKRCIFQATTTAAHITLQVGDTAGLTSYYDDLSCKQIGTGIGNHASQAGSVARPLYSGKYNLFNASNDLTNATWIRSGLTSVTSVGTGFRILPSATALAHCLQQSYAVAGLKTISFKAKADGYRYLVIGTNTAAYATVFDLQAGVITQAATLGAPAATISATVDAEGYWSCTHTNNNGTAWRFGPRDVGGPGLSQLDVWTADGVSAVLLKEVQLEWDATATRYQRTGPARNLLTKTDQIDNAAWAKTNATVVANAGVAPDGTLTADLLVEDTSSSAPYHAIGVTLSGLPAALHTWSFYFKPAGRTTLRFDVQNLDLAAFYFICTGAGSTAGTGASITALPDGWYRCSLPYNAQYSAYRIKLATGLGAGGVLYTGDGVSGGYFWGLQYERGTLTDYEPVDTVANTYDTVGFPIGLRVDGVDDWMSTPTINFSGTDKATVWAGIQKSGGTGFQTLVELGPGGAGQRSFAIHAPTSVKADYGFYITGTAVNNFKYTTATYPPGVSNVLAMQVDFAAATAALQSSGRIDGAVAALVNATLATTAGPFINSPLFLFRRGGTTLPFRGMFFGAIIRGAASNDAQIKAGEKWCAQRAGVTLP